MNFGITLSNRGVLVGLTTPRALLELADAVEASPHMDSVWCGDALFVNRRLDALTLLAAVAGRTERILLGPACMGSFALRNPMVLAYEWASLDVLSGGRTRMVACSGGGTGPDVGGRDAGHGLQVRGSSQADGRGHGRHAAFVDARTTRRSRASSSISAA